jgi:hypothetical protein
MFVEIDALDEEEAVPPITTAKIPRTPPEQYSRPHPPVESPPPKPSRFPFAAKDGPVTDHAIVLPQELFQPELGTSGSRDVFSLSTSARPHSEPTRADLADIGFDHAEQHTVQRCDNSNKEVDVTSAISKHSSDSMRDLVSSAILIPNQSDFDKVVPSPELQLDCDSVPVSLLSSEEEPAGAESPLGTNDFVQGNGSNNVSDTATDPIIESLNDIFPNGPGLRHLVLAAPEISEIDDGPVKVDPVPEIDDVPAIGVTDPVRDIGEAGIEPPRPTETEVYEHASLISAPETDNITSNSVNQDNANLKEVLDPLTPRITSLVSLASTYVSTTTDSTSQILNYIEFLRDSFELSQIESQIEALSGPTPRRRRGFRYVAQRLNAKLKAAEKRISDLQRDDEPPLAPAETRIVKDVAEMGIALSRERDSVGAAQSEVEFLQAKLSALEKRIALMTQKGSAYGPIR